MKARAWLTGNRTHQEFVKYLLVALLGWIWAFLIMYAMIDWLQLSISVPLHLPIAGVFVVDTWKIAFGLSSIFGLVHNFFLNKLLGGLRRIEIQHRTTEPERFKSGN
jgi:hypothetical protein